ncbi:MAG: hypothetical protein BV457_08040 [Thermoplasmata archaeon M9B1D]|nr:MAG: hypothetical protein BV457_08040 [Thermoplasmata archaeon M9B1D]PNX47527.1 MAG: hypothetical protein BV456_10870 [Thermoplasmata archaeon M8B2D]
MSILGVIPAAGEGKRWGGYLKEFLPINEEEKVIDHLIRSMKLAGATKFLVISNPEKIAAHSKYLSSRYDNIFYIMQTRQLDIWGAMLASLPFSEDYNLFGFPDTYFDTDAYNFNYQARVFGKAENLFIGMHETNMPERFGVLYNNKMVDKRTDLPKDTYLAWGPLIWTKNVANYWLERDRKAPILHYNDAINLVMDKFGYKIFKIKSYIDFASWKDYLMFLERIIWDTDSDNYQ